MEEIKYKVLGKRFLRGFIAGFVGSAGSIGVFVGQGVWDLLDWLVVLFVAGLAGGITGGLLAVDKSLRWKK